MECRVPLWFAPEMRVSNTLEHHSWIAAQTHCKLLTEKFSVPGYQVSTSLCRVMEPDAFEHFPHFAQKVQLQIRVFSLLSTQILPKKQ